MNTLYLTTPNLQALLDDLEPLDLVRISASGERSLAARTDLSFDYIGTATKPGTGTYDAEGNQLTPPEMYPDELCNVRCSAQIEAVLRSAEFEHGTMVLENEPADPVRDFAA
jgi:hypothetical protein